MNDLCVFTSGNDLSLLRKSCEAVMITLQTFDAPWIDYTSIKLRKAIDFLVHRIEPYAMWVDGNDTLVLKPEADILARLHAHGDPVIIAAERNCWPDPERADNYMQKDQWPCLGTQPIFINAGCIIGPRHTLVTAMHIALACAKDGDDQRAWTTAYLANMLPEVQIDHARQMFSCVADGDDALRADTCVMHWNGKTPGRKEYWDARSMST